MAEPFSNGNGNGNGYESLEARYRHLDDRVGRMGAEIAGINATLQNVSHTLDAVARRVNEPRRTDYGAIVAAAALVLSLGYSALMPVKERIEVHANALSAIAERHREMSMALGEISAYRASGTDAHRHLMEDVTEIRRDVQSVIAADAATDAKVEALAERVRDVDMAGSRKWVKRDN